MIPTWLKLSSIVCSSAGDTLSCAGRPTGPGISSLTYTTTSGHHRRYLPDFPEITGQSFRNPQVAQLIASGEVDMGSCAYLGTVPPVFQQLGVAKGGEPVPA